MDVLVVVEIGSMFFILTATRTRGYNVFDRKYFYTPELSPVSWKVPIWVSRKTS